MSQAAMPREERIIRTSAIGIGANLALAGFKAVVGLLSHSIAVVLDAVNNLSDALSSLITIIGTRLAHRKPDKKHPYGHGRVEYISAAIIAMIVLYAGLTSLIESVKKMIEPATPDYTAPGLIIIAVAVVVKLLLGHYVKKVGQEVDSDSLINSGEDARLDAVISAATLAAAGVWLIWGVSVEAWLAAVISVIILRSGVEMLWETISRVLGERASGEETRAIKQTAAAVDGVLGAYDLVLHDYGPERRLGSMDIEVPDTMMASEIDGLIRRVQQEVYQKHHVVLTAVGIYAYNTSGDEAARLRDEVRSLVMAHDDVLQMHGFYLDEDEVHFDIVVDFMCPDKESLYSGIIDQVSALMPNRRVIVNLDTDVSD